MKTRFASFTAALGLVVSLAAATAPAAFAQETPDCPPPSAGPGLEEPAAEPGREDPAARPGCEREGRSGVNVRLTGGITEELPNVMRVLDQLLETLESPDLWPNSNDKIGMTERAANWRMSDLAGELRRYLTDGELELNFRMTRAVGSALAAANTPSRNKMILFQEAGRAKDRKAYSDYYLARTLFHELMQVFQYEHWTAAGRMMDYETFPTETEAYLPKDLFATEEFGGPEDERTEPTGPAEPEDRGDEPPAAAGFDISGQWTATLTNTAIRAAAELQGPDADGFYTGVIQLGRNSLRLSARQDGAGLKVTMRQDGCESEFSGTLVVESPNRLRIDWQHQDGGGHDRGQWILTR